MSIFKPNLADIVESDVDQLVEDAQAEGVHLEFKRDMYGNADADRKEFLKDLSSFANSSGGHLVIGVDEAQGVASAIFPVAGDPDVALQRLEQIARTGLEPRVVGIQMRAVPIAAGGTVFVIRVPRSWNPPHRVSFQNTNRFHLRSSAGAHEASVEELRAIFANGAGMNDRMTAYVQERVRKVAEGEGAVRLAEEQGSTGKLVVHVLPFASFSGSVQVDVAAARDSANTLQPIGTNGNPRFNFDGVLITPNVDTPRSYTQVFRSGIIEAAKMRVSAPNEHNVWRIPMRSFVEPLYERLPGYLRSLQGLEVPPPYAVSLAVLGVQGSYLGVQNNGWGFEDQSRIDRDVLALPIHVIQDFGTDADYRAALGPALDALFNAGGFASAQAFLANYNDVGVWVGR